MGENREAIQKINEMPLEVSVSCWREKVKKGAWHFLDLDGGDQNARMR